MFFNTLAETTILEDANFIFTKLIVPYSFIEYILTIVVFGGAILLLRYSKMSLKKAMGSFFAIFVVFYTIKWCMYYAPFYFFCVLFFLEITKVVRWFYDM